MLWYISYNPNCTDYDECLVGLYIFFAIMFPFAGLAMYITSLCLRFGFHNSWIIRSNQPMLRVSSWDVNIGMIFILTSWAPSSQGGPSVTKDKRLVYPYFEMKSHLKAEIYWAFKFNWRSLHDMLFDGLVFSLCLWSNGIIHKDSRSLKYYSTATVNHLIIINLKK